LFQKLKRIEKEKAVLTFTTGEKISTLRVVFCCPLNSTIFGNLTVNKQVLGNCVFVLLLEGVSEF